MGSRKLIKQSTHDAASESHNVPPNKQFSRTLVVGKFSPFHRGHRFLLDSAQAACEQLVIVSYSRPEFAGCTAELRQQWLTQAYPQAQVLVVDAQAALAYDLIMPDNAADDASQRLFCAQLLERAGLLPIDAIFTSEDYGAGFAQFLSEYSQHSVAHVLLDKERRQFPVSGTAQRANPNAKQLEENVFNAMQCQRIALLGAESSGKTTLSQWLSQALNSPWVAEFGRTHWLDCQGELSSDDLLHIARTQVAHENQAVTEALHQGKSWVICDTSPLTTYIYHLLMFPNLPMPNELAALAERPYHQLFFSLADFPLVQDGTRQAEAFRKQQQKRYQAEFQQRQLQPWILQGSELERQQRLLTVMPPSYEKRPV